MGGQVGDRFRLRIGVSALFRRQSEALGVEAGEEPGQDALGRPAGRPQPNPSRKRS